MARSGKNWDELETEALARKKPGPSCSVKVLLEWLHEHDPKGADTIVRVMANHRLSTTSIHAALETRVEEWLLPSAWSLRHHRAGRCSCKDGS